MENMVEKRPRGKLRRDGSARGRGELLRAILGVQYKDYEQRDAMI